MIVEEVTLELQVFLVPILFYNIEGLFHLLMTHLLEYSLLVNRSYLSCKPLLLLKVEARVNYITETFLKVWVRWHTLVSRSCLILRLTTVLVLKIIEYAGLLVFKFVVQFYPCCVLRS